MDSLIIDQTGDSPQISFDIPSNRFMISGESRPENASLFYNPIIKWIKDFEVILQERKHNGSNHETAIFIFKLDYYNSISAKYMAEIISILKSLIVKGLNIHIEWHYEKSDDEMLDAGKEFSDLYELNFNFLEY